MLNLYLLEGTRTELLRLRGRIMQKSVALRGGAKATGEKESLPPSQITEVGIRTQPTFSGAFGGNYGQNYREEKVVKGAGSGSSRINTIDHDFRKVFLPDWY